MLQNKPFLITPTLSMQIDSNESNGAWVSFSNKEGLKISAFVDPYSRVISCLSCKESLGVVISLTSLLRNNEDEVYEFFECNKQEIERQRRLSNLQNL